MVWLLTPDMHVSLANMEVLATPGMARIEEDIARETTEAHAWWNRHWYDLEPEISGPETFTVPNDGPDPTKAQPLELLYEWRGRKHMVDDLSAIILCVEIRWSFVPRIGEERLHGPWEKTRRVPATVRSIPARPPRDGVYTLRSRSAGGTRTHAPAGSGAARMEHECHNWCDCWKDWLPFVHWRPWNNPPEAELQRWTEKLQPHGLLSAYLTRLLWEHRQTEPQKPGEVYKDWRSVRYFTLPHLGKTVDRVFMWPHGVLNVPKTGPRMQQERRYIKVWWQFFRKGAETKKPQKGALADVICSPSGKVPKRIGADVEYTIVKNDPCAEDTPHYQTHDSAEDVMAFFDCSRATAFRRIQEGFRIPEELKTVTTEPKATTAHRLTLRILAGGGYMKLTPGPVYAGSGYYSESVTLDSSLSRRTATAYSTA